MLLITEALVRLLGIAPPLQHLLFTVDDPYVPFKHPAYSTIEGGFGHGEYRFRHVHNSLGFRDEEHDAIKGPGEFTIFAVGDSFAYGAGAAYEDSLLVRLEAQLNSGGGAGGPVEIVKAGVCGYYPDLEERLLRGYGPRFDPDMVLVFFTPNDVTDTAAAADLTINDRGEMISRQAAVLGAPGELLYRGSHVFRILWQGLAAPRFEPQLSHVYGEGGRYEHGWRKVEQAYDRMLQTSRALDAALVLVSLPIKESWSAGGDYPDMRLRAWARARGVTFIPVLPALRDRAQLADVYWKIDGHPNGTGYGLMAEIVARALERSGEIK